MLAPSKRRASFYTLPIVIGVGFLLVAGLAAWQRANVIAELTEEVAHGGKPEATAAVRQLAAIPNPPIAVLAEAAASDEHTTAEAAQVAINRLLGRWQQQIENKQRLSSVASQLTNLSAALAEQRHAFAAADYSWLASVTRRIAQMANGCPPKKTPLVAMHCDEIMSVIGNANIAPASNVGPEQSSGTDRLGQALAPAAEMPGRETQRTQMEEEFARYSTQPAAAGSVDDHPLPNENPDFDSGQNSLRHDRLGARTSGSAASVGPRRQAAPFGELATSGSITECPDWSLPSSLASSSTSTHSTASDDDASAPDQFTLQSGRKVAPAGSYSTRELLERWQSAIGDDRHEIESELAARGFKHVSPTLAQQYLSENAEVRQRLVDSVLKQPGVDARPWLFLLADDEDAEVRLLAVTVMATSDDKSLIEKAWQISIRDHDPRIADLAGRLRDRRAGTQLR